MGLTDPERGAFVKGLQQKGWSLKDDTVTSPSGGLWFSESHFTDWTLQQFQEIFAGRADRIRKAKLGDWEQSEQENRDASDIAGELQKGPGTQQ